MLRARLKIHEPKKTVPRRIDAFAKLSAKQWAYTHVFGERARDRPAILVVAPTPSKRKRVESAKVWVGGDFSRGDVPLAATEEWTYDGAYKALKGMGKGQSSGKDVLKGQWKGYLISEASGPPSIELERKIATYVRVHVRSQAVGGRCWNVTVEVLAEGRWYAVAEPVTTPECVTGTLEAALLKAVELGKEAVAQSCVVRDTVRRQSRDAEYAALRPIPAYREPVRTPTDRFRQNGTPAASRAASKAAAAPKPAPVSLESLVIPADAPARQSKTWSDLWKALGRRLVAMGQAKGWTKTTSRRITKLMQSGNGADARLHKRGAAALGYLLGLPALQAADTAQDTTEAKRLWNHVLSKPSLYDWLGEGCGCEPHPTTGACGCAEQPTTPPPAAPTSAPAEEVEPGRVDLGLLDMGIGVVAYVGSEEARVFTNSRGKYVVELDYQTQLLRKIFDDRWEVQRTVSGTRLPGLALPTGESRPFDEDPDAWEQYIARMLFGWGIRKGSVTWGKPPGGGEPGVFIRVPHRTAWPNGRTAAAVELELQAKGFYVVGVAERPASSLPDLVGAAGVHKGFVGSHPVTVKDAQHGKARIEWERSGEVTRIYLISAKQRASMVSDQPKATLPIPGKRPRQNRASSWARWGRELLKGWGLKRGRAEWFVDKASRSKGLLVVVPKGAPLPDGRDVDTLALELEWAGVPVFDVREQADDAAAGFIDLQAKPTSKAKPKATAKPKAKTSPKPKPKPTATASGGLSPVGQAIFEAAQATLFSELGLSPD